MTPQNEVTLHYLTWLERNLGRGSETIELPAHAATVDDILNHLITRGGAYEVFAKKHVIFANIDNAIVPHHHAVSGVRNIAFFSPIVGG